MSKFLFNIFYCFIWLLTLLPLRLLYVLSDFFFVLIYGVVRYRRKVVWNNLTNAFPEKTDKEKSRISRRFYRYLCDYFFETMKLVHMSEKEILKRVKYKTVYQTAQYKEGRNIVGMLGHTANWEWLTAISLKDKYHWVVPYHPLTNKHFDGFLTKLRQRFGAEPIPMNRVYKRLLELQSAGDLFIAGMIADQSTPHLTNQNWVTFLNQDTVVMTGSERIAQKANALVVYCKMTKIKRGYYELEVIPITENVNEEDEHFVTKRYFELLEEHIKEQPEYWLWSHRRWKRKRPVDQDYL